MDTPSKEMAAAPKGRDSYTPLRLVVCSLFSLIVLCALPAPLVAAPVFAAPASVAIEMKPRSARANLKSEESRLSRGVAGDAVESAIERIKSLGKKGDPVNKGIPTTPGKLKAGEDGTPGLAGKGTVPEQNTQAPNIPNLPGPPPQPQSIIPQLCQQLLGLAQQLAQQGQQGGQQQAGPPSQGSNPANCGPVG